MANIFIIHGSYGSPKENWFPWLKKELEKLGHKVFVPQFPIPVGKIQDSAYGGHDLKGWFKKLDEYKKYIDKNTIFVAHSRGNIFLYHYLATLKNSVSAVFMVAPWKKYIWYPKGWKKIDTFHRKPFNWKKISQNSQYFEVYQSTNDDTSVEEGQVIARLLNAKLVIVKNAGHFNVATYKKFNKFPLLLKNISSFLKK